MCFDVKKVPDEPFIPLTDEEKDEVYRAFSGKNRYGALVKRFFFYSMFVWLSNQIYMLSLFSEGKSWLLMRIQTLILLVKFFNVLHHLHG